MQNSGLTLTKRKVEHNLLKHNLGQKLNVIKDADIFLFLFWGFLHFKSILRWNIENKGNANQEGAFVLFFLILTPANIHEIG